MASKINKAIEAQLKGTGFQLLGSQPKRGDNVLFNIRTANGRRFSVKSSGIPTSKEIMQAAKHAL